MRVLWGDSQAAQADATLDGTRKVYFADLATVPLLIIDDLGMRKLPHTAAEDLLEALLCNRRSLFRLCG